MENYEQYAKYTKKKDWGKICEVNGVNLDSFGTKKELRALPDYLEEDISLKESIVNGKYGNLHEK